jgi:hypothetical protein
LFSQLLADNGQPNLSLRMHVCKWGAWLSGNPLSHLTGVGHLIFLRKMCDGSGGNSCDVSRSTDEEPWPSERPTGSGICLLQVIEPPWTRLALSSAGKRKRKTNQPAAGFKCSDKHQKCPVSYIRPRILSRVTVDHSSLHKRSFMTWQNDYKLRTLKHYFKRWRGHFKMQMKSTKSNRFSIYVETM